MQEHAKEKPDGEVVPVPVATPSRALVKFWSKFKVSQQTGGDSTTTSEPPKPVPLPAPVPTETETVIDPESCRTVSSTDVPPEPPAPSHPSPPTTGTSGGKVEAPMVKTDSCLLYDPLTAMEFDRLCQPEFYQPIEARNYKLDVVELACKIEQYKIHPRMKAFEACINAKLPAHVLTTEYVYGEGEPVEEVTGFELWLDAERNTSKTPHQPTVETSPSPGATPVSALRAVLTRSTTVDLGGSVAAVVPVVEAPSPPDPPTPVPPTPVTSSVKSGHLKQSK